MKKYLVKGYYTISFEMEVENMGYEINIETEWNGNSVFTYDDAQLAADGEPRDITVECLEDEDEDEDDEDEE